MCGISGIINVAGDALGVTQIELKTMAGTLEGRGPDAEGIWLHKGGLAGLVNRRLATQDARSIANQPLYSSDGKVVCVLNGEIYNHGELRNELKAKGCIFKTLNDTEVLANGFAVWGADVLERIKGQFAFGVVNMDTGETLIARDRMGICPLYYTVHEGRLLFGSTVEAILSLGSVPRSLDPQGVYDYFIMDSVGWEKTFYDNISTLRAGHCLHLRLGQTFEKRRYYSIDADALNRLEGRSEDEWVEHLRAVILDAVSTCMLGDKEVGVYLSGGIDSVSVMALIRHLFPDRTVKTFSAGFAHALTGEKLGEVDFAGKMAKRFGTEHNEIIVTAEEIAGDIGSFDLPPSSVIDAVVKRLASSANEAGVNVALSGEGADEIFFGYDHFMAAVKYFHPQYSELLEKYNLRGDYADSLNPKTAVLEDLFRGGGGNIDLDNNPSRIFKRHDDIRPVRDFAKYLVKQLEASEPKAGIDQKLIYIDYTQKVPDNLLRRAEGPSMGQGVEMRFPFLWDDLVAIMYRMPMDQRLGDGTTKYLLRKIMAPFLPQEALVRPKSPFGLPTSRRMHFKDSGLDFKKPALQHFFWLNREQIEPLLMEGAYTKEGLFQESFVKDLLTAQRDKDSCGFNVFLWKLWNFAAWYENWIVK